MATNGKIVEGKLPPPIIAAHRMGRFSVSGREASVIAPNGKVFYHNKKKNLKVVFHWHGSGCTTRADAVADCKVTGEKKGEEGFLFTSAPVPWSQTLECDANPRSWIYTLRENQGMLAAVKEAAKDIIKKDINL